MKKITFSELVSVFDEFNKQHDVTSQFSGESINGVIVFTKESFNKPYSLESRSYVVNSGNKYFIAGMGGNSLYGDCLDGSERGVRLDWYLGSWGIDYCYLLDEEGKTKE